MNVGQHSNCKRHTAISAFVSYSGRNRCQRHIISESISNRKKREEAHIEKLRKFDRKGSHIRKGRSSTTSSTPTIRYANEEIDRKLTSAAEVQEPDERK